jgi:hypothetical protein
MEAQKVWRNEGYVEKYEFLKNSRICTVTSERIIVRYKYDKNLSTSFEMRHAVDANGTEGFTYFVSGCGTLYEKAFRPGVSKNVYVEVLREGEAVQQEQLRKTWLDFNRV